jgi:hypothetical protein
MPEVIIQFRPLATFHSTEYECDYCEGMTYTIRAGNDKLAALVEQWIAEGKVEAVQTGPKSAQPATLSATGTVS